jgi:glucose-1-phosphate thymidylyltransferase
MKGIVLAGGTGSRLWPITKATSKQLLPVYDKPMIYYPLSTLMLAGIRDILIITTPHDQLAFQELLGDGSQFGVNLYYEIQPKPEGLAQAFIIGENFLAGESCLMILGDNIFHGVGLGHKLAEKLPKEGAHIFTYEVSDPSQYGVLTLDKNGTPESISEKPKNPNSNLAVTGLYYFDHRVSDIAKKVTPSSRGELEIASIIECYLNKNELTRTHLGRGVAWLDTGNPEAMHDAATFVRVVEQRTGLKIACLEEIALEHNWVDRVQLESNIKSLGNGSYRSYVEKILGAFK